MEITVCFFSYDEISTVGIYAPKNYYICPMIKIDELKDRINRAAIDGQKFLFAVDYEQTQALFIEEPMNQTEILFRFGSVKNYTPKSKSHCQYSAEPLTLEQYTQKFERVMHSLQRGDSFLTNLTVRTPVHCLTTLEELLQTTDSLYGIVIPNRFVCFSPERFVRISENTIHSNPMKGTIDASIENASEKILNDYKESAEHATVVDLIRNDLAMVASNVRVERYRYIDRVDTDRGAILQVSSEIAGDLPHTWREQLAETIFRLLPAGSICGAPKPPTLRLITQAEQEPRGFYTGIFGYFDGNTLDTAVAIRFIEQHNDGSLYFRSGGGITINSRVEEEYQEVKNKIYIPLL